MFPSFSVLCFNVYIAGICISLPSILQLKIIYLSQFYSPLFLQHGVCVCVCVLLRAILSFIDFIIFLSAFTSRRCFFAVPLSSPTHVLHLCSFLNCIFKYCLVWNVHAEIPKVTSPPLRSSGRIQKRCKRSVLP